MILVTGAKGVVGRPLCDRLSSQGRAYLSISRQAPDSESQIQWDLSKSPSEATRRHLAQASALIHCAPIWLLPPHLELFSELNIKRLIVFSSTSVLSKRDSESHVEQKLVDQLHVSEQALLKHCQHNNLKLIILRPTLIYGYGRDQNVSHIAKFIRRFGFMLLVDGGIGLRQPVHADDLVQVTLTGLDAESDRSQVYTVAGKDVITYREMVRRIFVGLDRRPLIISIPLWIFRPALIIAAKLSRFSYTPEMADRMNQNLNYDYSDASQNLGFSPQGFLEQPERDLPK